MNWLDSVAIIKTLTSRRFSLLPPSPFSYMSFSPFLLDMWCFFFSYLLGGSFLGSRPWIFTFLGMSHLQILSSNSCAHPKRRGWCRGSARYLFDVKFSCICRSQCQLQSSFIVFVNLYARVLVSEAPDVDFKYLIFHDSMASLWQMHHLKVQWVFLASCPCSVLAPLWRALRRRPGRFETGCWQFCTREAESG